MIFSDADAFLIVTAINAVRRGAQFPVELRYDRDPPVFPSQLVQAHQNLLAVVSALPTLLNQMSYVESSQITRIYNILATFPFVLCVGPIRAALLALKAIIDVMSFPSCVVTRY